MKVFEALGQMAEEADATDDLICAVYDYAAMLIFFKMSEQTAKHVEGRLRVIRDTLDGVPMKIIREDRLN
jgi:hypothetical protein